MNTKQKFESIDQSQLTESQKEILGKIKTATKDFTITDEKSLEKVDGALDNIIEKLKKTNPQALKVEEKKEVVKPKKAVSKKETKSKTKKPAKQKKEPSGKRTIFSIAKEIRKDGESWEDAKKRAKKVMEGEKEETTKKMKTETDKLLAFIKRRKELEGLSGTSVKKDSKIEALPKGRRVSKKGWKNQYGESEGGRVYYENRDNRTDRLAPNFADKIYLENGGGMDSKLEAGVYRVGKPIKVNANLYEQKIVEIFDNGDIATASDYGRSLSDFKSMNYPIISKEKLESMYLYGGSFFKKGGTLLTARERYIAELKGLTGLRQEGIESFIDENNLTNDEILNIVIGLGRKQIERADVVTAIVGKKNNAESKRLIRFAKSDKALRAYANGGGVEEKLVGSFYYDSRKDKTFRVISSDKEKIGIQYFDKLKNPIGKIENVNISDFEYLTNNGAWSKYKQSYYANGGAVGDDFKEVIDLGAEQYYTRPFAEVETDSRGDVELVVVATIRDLENYMSEEDLPEEGNFELDITLVPTKEFISEEILESANDEDSSSISDDSAINVVNYAGGLNYNPQERVNFESQQDALDYLMSKELKDKINTDARLAGFVMDRRYNRAGQDNWGYLDYLMGVTSRFADGGAIIGIPETPLARGLNIDYTGLVGETGAMSSGELFENGGEFMTDPNFGDFQNQVYAEGGSLGNHGLKEGDQVLKTLSGGIQKVKTKSGDVVYVDLATGYRGAEPPLPFEKGGSVYRQSKYLTKEQWEKWNDYVKTGKIDGKKEKNIFIVANHIGVSVAQINAYQREEYAKGGYAEKGVYVEILEEDIDLSDDRNLRVKKTQEGKNLSFEELREKHDASPEALAFDKGGRTRERKYVNYSQKHEVRYSKNKPHRRGYGYEDGGNINSELENFDINNLDYFETMQYNQFLPSLGKVGALQVLINNVEGDYSQLSEELAELAEKQMSTEEWNEATREMILERDGYAKGGKMPKCNTNKHKND